MVCNSRFNDFLNANMLTTTPSVKGSVCFIGGSVRCLSWQLTGANARKIIEAARIYSDRNRNNVPICLSVSLRGFAKQSPAHAARLLRRRLLAMTCLGKLFR